MTCNDEYNENLESRCSELESMIMDVNENLSDTEDELNNAENRIDELEGENQKLEDKFEEVEKEKEELINKFESHIENTLYVLKNLHEEYLKLENTDTQHDQLTEMMECLFQILKDADMDDMVSEYANRVFGRNFKFNIKSWCFLEREL